MGNTNEGLKQISKLKNTNGKDFNYFQINMRS